METVSTRSKISYEAYRVITELLRAHLAEHGPQLRGMVAFGDIVVNGDTYDIDLLEVIDNWKGDKFYEFESTAEFPMRGRLRLYLLQTAEFTNPGVDVAEEDRQWVRDLLARVREGYEIIMEIPSGALSGVLQRTHGWSTMTPPPSGMGYSTSPLQLKQSK